MYRYQLKGYLYGEGKPLDLIWVGYPYIDEELMQSSRVNLHENLIKIEMGQYWRGNDLYLKFGPVDRYCNSFQLYYSAHYKNTHLGLDKSAYKVYATATGDKL